MTIQMDSPSECEKRGGGEGGDGRLDYRVWGGASERLGYSGPFLVPA